jgi:hypothetical protein
LPEPSIAESLACAAGSQYIGGLSFQRQADSIRAAAPAFDLREIFGESGKAIAAAR